jgi:hypothetical protein
MLSERDIATLRDMLHHIDLAEKFGHGRDFEGLRDDLMPLYAVTRCLEIISEASRRLSNELKARHHQIKSCSPIPKLIALTHMALRSAAVSGAQLCSNNSCRADYYQAFVEWWPTFDCAAEQHDRWTKHFETEAFAKWPAARRRFMQAKGR